MRTDFELVLQQNYYDTAIEEERETSFKTILRKQPPKKPFQANAEPTSEEAKEPESGSKRSDRYNQEIKWG